MSQSETAQLAVVIKKNEQELLGEWLRLLQEANVVTLEAEARELSAQFLRALSTALDSGSVQLQSGPAWDELRKLLGDFSRSRVRQGFTPTQTAMYIFSLKQPLFLLLRKALADQPQVLSDEMWIGNLLLDRLGLYTIEIYQQTRDQVIVRQQQELLELSTPVVKLWDNILALPLIGTLDSARTQVVMESLLQKIVETSVAIAIIDITGVPTVDTLVAQHLMKTIAAARLMGADCIISGIRPQIAQTIVHLGVDLTDVVTKATLADAFIVALERTGTDLSLLARAR
jgi:rsbT co-antagonist protein RsbR